MIIAIDGPSASGKGTLGKLLAHHYSFAHLDTGLLYRAVALSLRETRRSPLDKEAAIRAAHVIDLNSLNEKSLRQQDLAELASVVAAVPEVRQALLQAQRRFARTLPGAVLDGRDIGTVICPDAEVKFFVTARLEIRAQRRYQEMCKSGGTQSFEQILAETMRRDERDCQRAVAPLKIAQDAIVLDTSDWDASQTFTFAKEAVDRYNQRNLS